MGAGQTGSDLLSVCSTCHLLIKKERGLKQSPMGVTWIKPVTQRFCSGHCFPRGYVTFWLIWKQAREHNNSVFQRHLRCRPPVCVWSELDSKDMSILLSASWGWRVGEGAKSLWSTYQTWMISVIRFLGCVIQFWELNIFWRTTNIKCRTIVHINEYQLMHVVLDAWSSGFTF